MSQADRVSQAGRVPLSVLDLSPRSQGASAGDALRNTLDLARRTEKFGYHRYWLAEHHLVPGVVSSAPAVVIALVADATTRIRVGSGAVQMGHHTAVTVAEEFGTLAQIHPARIDLGLGRPAVDRLFAAANSNGQPPGSDQPAAASAPAATAPAASGAAATVIDGLLLPAPPRMRVNVERLRRQFALVGYRPGAEDEYGQQVRDIQAFLRGDYRTAEGEHLTVPAAEQGPGKIALSCDPLR
ncbi:LLM class flavin-dependent oxidoreductase [Candidatus Frankia alpina]|uniref:LLM class flavin-dependent oxidoreductase n=1 Tax=Candidatus Frankia alpina TaxID=2699483 RepID=UPI001F472BA6|nr:LLM class flavin-dependent oxidoreductase [Candidatus Frankia alpina]